MVCKSRLALLFLSIVFISNVATAATINVTTTEDEFDNENGLCSLREAVYAANDNTNVDGDCVSGESDVADEIVIPAGTYTLDITCENIICEFGVDDCIDTSSVSASLLAFGGVRCGDLDIVEDVTIRGAGQGDTVIQVDPDAIDNDLEPTSVSAESIYDTDGYRIFDVVGRSQKEKMDFDLENESDLCEEGCSAGLEVTFQDMTLKGGVDDEGGAIHFDAGNGDDCEFTSVKVVNVKAEENLAYREGGAIAGYGQLVVENSEIVNNQAGDTFFSKGRNADGGGIALFGPESYCYGKFTSTITDSSVNENTALSGSGGGIFNAYNSNLDITNTSVDLNRASYYGGGIFNTRSNMNITDGSISQNLGTESDLVFNLSDEPVVEVDEEEHAVLYGGGLYNESENIYRFRRYNIAQNGIKVGSVPTDVTITGTTISDNKAAFGGAGILNATEDFACGFSSSSVDSDIASEGFNVCAGSLDIGANVPVVVEPDENIVLTSSTLTITGATISNNSLSVNNNQIRFFGGRSLGAGLYNAFQTGLVKIVETTISNNTGGTVGAGILNEWLMEVDKSTINNNATSELFQFMKKVPIKPTAEAEALLISIGGGGGVANGGSLVMTNSTVSANETFGSGAGIFTSVGEDYVEAFLDTNEEEEPDASPTPESSASPFPTETPSFNDLFSFEPLPEPGTSLRNVTVALNVILESNFDFVDDVLSDEAIYFPSDAVFVHNGGGLATQGGTVKVRNSIVAGNRDESENFSEEGFIGTRVDNNGGNGGDFSSPSPSPTVEPDVNPNDFASFAPDCWVVPNDEICKFIDGKSFCDFFTPEIVSEQHNLIGNNSGCVPFDAVENENQDKIGTSDTPIDALLDPLADNGGATLTHAAQIGSPAIDMGNPTGEVAASAVDASFACESTDQRGVARPTDGDGNGTATCDIGAFEAPQVVLDCNEVPNGDAVVDECGVCGGDGSSCAATPTPTAEPDTTVTCNEINIAQTQLALDGAADDSLKLAKRLRRHLKRRTGKRVAGKAIVNTINSLRNENWNFAWGLPSVIVEDCTGATDACVQVSNVAALSSYVSNAEAIATNIKKLIRKLNKSGLSKRLKRQFRKQNAGILANAIASTEAVPATTTQCS